jgi:hypothetical protein
VLGEFTHAPGEPVGGRAGPLIGLPGRVPVPPGLGALFAGRVEGTLGRVETVTGGIKRAFGLLHRGQGIGERILGHGQPAPQVSQVPNRPLGVPAHRLPRNDRRKQSRYVSIGRPPPAGWALTALMGRDDGAACCSRGRIR